MNEKRRILVIDDNNSVGMIIRRILELKGNEVFVATNGNEGLKMANTLSPDVILLDVNLPDMDGFEVCAKIRSPGTTSKIAIIMMTASDEPEVREQGFAKGADDYLTKPIGGNELIAHVEAQLQRVLRGKDRR